VLVVVVVEVVVVGAATTCLRECEPQAVRPLATTSRVAASQE
jgi:hypothetical protein